LTITPLTTAAASLSGGTASWGALLATTPSTAVTITSTAPSTIVVDMDEVVNSLAFNAANGQITVARGQLKETLTMGTALSPNPATMQVNSGNVDITATTHLYNNLTISLSTGTTLQFHDIHEDAAGSSLTVMGSGVLTINGTSTYSGGTNIEGGSVVIGTSASLGTGPLAADAGKLDLSGNSLLVPSFSGAAGLVTNNGTGPAVLVTAQSNASGAIATDFSGSINDGLSQVVLKVTGGTLTLSGTNAYTGGTYVEGTGELIVGTASPGSDLAIDAQEIGSNLYVGNDLAAFAPNAPPYYGGAIGAGSDESFGGAIAASPSFAIVPEPGTLALIGAGAALLGLRALRRRKR
jgi:fibronectin-binding autotransporter adhesin